jgi:hypothetical protein
LSRDPVKITGDGGCTKQEVFHVDDTALAWKKMPSRAFITKRSEWLASKLPRSGLKSLGDFKMKTMLICHSENVSAFEIILNLLCLFPLNGTTKPEWQHICLQHGWLNVLSSVFFCSEKRVPFKILLLFGDASGHWHALMEMYDEVNAIFMSVNTVSSPAHESQSSLTFNSYYLRNTFQKL